MTDCEYRLKHKSVGATFHDFARGALRKSSPAAISALLRSESVMDLALSATALPFVVRGVER